MLIETKNRINEVIAALKVGNTLCPDHVYLYNPYIDNPSGFQGITDAISDYIFIERIPMDSQMIKDQFTPTNHWGKSMWKVIGRTSFSNTDLLGFCVNRVHGIGGVNVLSYTDESERIYLEETDEQLQMTIHLVRVIFSVSTIVDWCQKTINLCQDGDC